MPDAEDWQQHDPVDTDLTQPPNYATELIFAYGLAVLHWGKLEGFVDDLLIGTYGEAQKAGDVKRIPNAWLAKCEKLAKRLDLSVYAAQLPKAKDVIAPLLELGGDRNLVIHAAAYGFSPGPPNLLHLRKYDFGPSEEVTMRHLRVPTQALYDFCDACIDLHAKLLPLVFAIVGRPAPQLPEQSP